jgi:hypothetical protein
MLYVDQHKHIKNRSDFFRTLGAAIQASNDLLKVAPGDGRIMSVLRQLEMIRTWTDNGRDPTKEERWKLQIGVILMREFESEGDQRVADWAELSKEVEGYFNLWVDDATYQTVDEDDLPDFPEDEDDVTHLRI